MIAPSVLDVPDAPNVLNFLRLNVLNVLNVLKVPNVLNFLHDSGSPPSRFDGCCAKSDLLSCTCPLPASHLACFLRSCAIFEIAGFALLDGFRDASDPLLLKRARTTCQAGLH